MNRPIRRSLLIMPIQNLRFVEKAYSRGADALMLDLEDSIPWAEKENARKMIPDVLPLVTRAGVPVFIRVNKPPEHMFRDLKFSVCPGVAGICLPKVESAREVLDLELAVEVLEKESGMKPGTLFFDLMIESPLGTLNLGEISSASNRTQSLTLGPEDYCRELGVEPSGDGIELVHPLAQMVTICKARGIMPTGLLGSIGEFRDLSRFEQYARRAKQIGCEGASCIHPDQVKILNQVFSPDPARVEHARQIVAAFEEGLQKGTASVTVGGQMVDIPVYHRAKTVLAQRQAIEELEQRKGDALVRLGEYENKNL
jgi:citrate lyase subunit beta/citryl-CoA lyase